MSEMMSMDAVVEGIGAANITRLPACSYRDCSTVMVTPTRGMIHASVVEAWQKVIAPMNQKRHHIFIEGAEVADAYNKAIEMILNDYRLSRYKYVMTLEDDNIVPANAQLRLLDAIEEGPYDGVSGLYFRKKEPHWPVVCGDPAKGPHNMDVRDVREGMASGGMVECNGIPMGCSLYRMDLFKQMPRPWFTTVNEYLMLPDGNVMGVRRMGQDLAFCEQARWLGKRFAVDCSVKVGHLNLEDGKVY